MSDEYRFLITTADERTWKFDMPVLFLGEWCRMYNRKEIWSNMDALIATPFGLQQQKKIADFSYVRKVKSEIITEIYEILNTFHKTNHSKHYWDIILGHWIHRYVAVIFNRYYTLENCIKENQISGTIIYEDEGFSLSTQDSDQFIWMCNNDVWNNILFGKIFPYFEFVNFPIDKIKLTSNKLINSLSVLSSNNHHKSLKKFFYQKFRNMIFQFFQFFRRESDALIISSYLPFKIEMKLNLVLNQFPSNTISDKITYSLPDISTRNKLKNQFKTFRFRNFEKCVRDLLFETLPTCFLEDYGSLQKIVNNLSWPKSPKFIFTSNGFDTNELFKVYAAEKVDQGVNYYTGQHGNNYGTYLFNYSEIECVDTSDRFFTWGWTNGNPKHIPAFNFKTAGIKQIKNNEKGGLLLIEVCIPQRVETWDVYAEFIKYQEEQFEFVNALPKNIHQNLTLRLHSSFYRHKWFENLRWKDKSPNTRIEYGYEKIINLYTKSRLVVFSYDSTGLLETLALNIPTIGFWQGDLSHLNESAIPYYEMLQQVGIIHYSPESASKKVTEIWDNVMSWWESRIVQDARERFCERFSRTSQNPVNELKELLLKNK